MTPYPHITIQMHFNVHGILMENFFKDFFPTRVCRKLASRIFVAEILWQLSRVHDSNFMGILHVNLDVFSLVPDIYI